MVSRAEQRASRVHRERKHPPRCEARAGNRCITSLGGMQFMDREPIYHDHAPPPSDGHGFYEEGKEMCLRWNSRVGTVYLDGAHVMHAVKMGDRVTLSTNALPLRLFTSAWFRRNHADRWPTLRSRTRRARTTGS